jgi:hypothetical protein
MRVLFLAGLIWDSQSFQVNVEAPPLCKFTSPTSLNIGSVMPMCVFMMSAPVSDPTSPSYIRPEIKSIAFGVPVDTYVMLDLTNSYSAFNHPQRDQDNLYAWMTGSPTSTGWARECALQEGVPKTFKSIDTTTAYSCPQLVMTMQTVVPLASIVAVVEEGKLVNLIWDNQCQTCPTMSDECIGGNLALTLANSTTSQQYVTSNDLSKITDNKICSVAHSDCKSTTNTTGVNCDFRVLLTWKGTDSRGKRLLSSSLRMTQFSGSSVGSMWNSVANSFNPNEDVNANNTVVVR